MSGIATGKAIAREKEDVASPAFARQRRYGSECIK